MSDLSLYNEGDVLEWFWYLDKLRKGGKTNMVAAAPHLVKEFGLSKERAMFVLDQWAKTYHPKITVDRRARAVYFANGGT